MTPRDRRPRRAAAVLGLLAGLALLLGAVLDGGLSTPTRTDPVGAAAAAVPHGDLTAAGTAQPREDHPAWGHSLWSNRSAALAAGLATLAVVTATLIGSAPLAGPRHRAPALLAARHRGPPVVV
ncbi:MAG TPA: hypothetical protein VK507_05985 [Iamia sp.]|nr:hypothetical protein [Iamia sp.]